MVFFTGQANGAVGLQLLDQKGIREIEAKARGVKAIWSPNTGIVSYRDVTKHYVKDFTELGGNVFYGFRVAAIEKQENDLLVKSDSFEEVNTISHFEPLAPYFSTQTVVNAFL